MSQHLVLVVLNRIILRKSELVYIPGSGAVLARSSQPLVGLMMNFRK
jgi:hypothetical protein